MEYIDNIYTWLAFRCTGVSPSNGSGYYGPFVVPLTADMTNITVDSTVITTDLTVISVDEII